MEERAYRKVTIEGLVQGVGFRPFAYRLALKHGLGGSIRNTRFGVEILLSGKCAAIDAFVQELSADPPPVALIKRINVQESEPFDTICFEIIPSSHSGDAAIFIPPDISICGSCLEDFQDEAGRYFHYPFVNCTDCGPRYSIITMFPYDRSHTTMNEFAMCPECAGEYGDITSRRYHAEPVSCPKCGPRFRLLDGSLNEIRSDSVFEEAAKLMRAGAIIAVKGIGGCHLVLDAENAAAVAILRERKKRDRKPFAMMFRDIKKVKEYCDVSDDEAQLLESREKPIVLLRKHTELPCGNEIAGDSPWYGVMLPYAPFHMHLLEASPVLIFTSANISGEPIVYRDEDLDQLSGIADYFLIHDRKIVRFVEDSVIKRVGDVPLLMRKSRGYAPAPFFAGRRSLHSVLGFGGDLKASISLLWDDVLFQSQYLGDLEEFRSYEDYTQTFEDLKQIFQLEPEILACDLHPSYHSVNFAESVSKDRPLIKVQHHKAHIASVAFEQGWFDEPVIGIALDGTGYGEDGAIWGGEIFTGSVVNGFERAGHLSYLPLPFGDLSIKEPQRTAFAYFAAAGIGEPALFDSETQKNYDRLRDHTRKCTLFTSSTGRLFDAVSFLLGFRQRVSYEGEAAIALENLIYRRYTETSTHTPYSIVIANDNGMLTLQTDVILKDLYSDWKSGVDASSISLRFHRTVVEGLMQIVRIIAGKTGIERVALSGGSFQNSYLLRNFGQMLDNQGFDWAINRFTPPNDACVSVGQCAIAGFSETSTR